MNCGGHAFPTDGLLLGLILEEFRTKKADLTFELLEMCNSALIQKGRRPFAETPAVTLIVQGGVGTAEEHRSLIEHYRLDDIGWSGPFLLVPEATNVDEDTLHQHRQGTAGQPLLQEAHRKH